MRPRKLRREEVAFICELCVAGYEPSRIASLYEVPWGVLRDRIRSCWIPGFSHKRPYGNEVDCD